MTMPQPISPLEGEMAGRPEGGVTERKLKSRCCWNSLYCAALISLTIFE